METLRVLCVKWGDKYGPEWVYRLRNMVQRNLTVPHEFVCITEAPVEGVTCLPLVCDLPHWWQKVGLLQRGFFPGWNLYLDLDVVITSNIDELLSAAMIDDSRLWMRDDFSYSILNPKQGLNDADRERLGGLGTCNSSVMCWKGDAACEAFDAFTPDVMDRLHGDQNWITKALWPKKIGLYVNEFIGSYKYGQLRNESIRPVMVFHGNPKMDTLPNGHELRRIWEAA